MQMSQDQRYVYQVTANDADLLAQDLTFTLLTGPAGMMLDRHTGLLSWTPTTFERRQLVSVGVTDGVIDTPVIQTFTLFVGPSAHPQSPILTVPSPGQATDNQAANGQPATLVTDALSAGVRQWPLTRFAGSFGSGNASKPAGSSSTGPLIEWGEDDTADTRHTATIGRVPQQASWLQRFLLHLGASEEEANPNHDLEVVLPAKKR
jgi:hypothetical protein